MSAHNPKEAYVVEKVYETVGSGQETLSRTLVAYGSFEDRYNLDPPYDQSHASKELVLRDVRRAEPARADIDTAAGILALEQAAYDKYIAASHRLRRWTIGICGMYSGSLGGLITLGIEAGSATPTARELGVAAVAAAITGLAGAKVVDKLSSTDFDPSNRHLGLQWQREGLEKARAQVESAA